MIFFKKESVWQVKKAISNQLKLYTMNKEQILDKILEMVCDLPLEEQFEIMEEAKELIQENWDENYSNSWEGYVP